jgi:hypothetical protein
MSGGIFAIDANNGLVEMTEASYDSEQILQALLAEHPGLIAGDQIDPDEPRRWILVSRELGPARGAQAPALA